MAQSLELSSREWEVVNQLLEGKSNKEIAAALHISVRTVEFHLKNVYDKLQVSSRTELILKLRQSTVVDQGEVAQNGDTSDSRPGAKSLRQAVSGIGKELGMQEFVTESARKGGETVTFFEAIVLCLSKYADFNGRASRSEFWWFALAVTLVTSALTYLNEAVASVFLIAVLLPLLAAGARRLRDSGKSAWWQLFLLVPVGGIVLVGILWAAPSTDSLSEKDALSA